MGVGPPPEGPGEDRAAVELQELLVSAEGLCNKQTAQAHYFCGESFAARVGRCCNMVPCFNMVLFITSDPRHFRAAP